MRSISLQALARAANTPIDKLIRTDGFPAQGRSRNILLISGSSQPLTQTYGRSVLVLAWVHYTTALDIGYLCMWVKLKTNWLLISNCLREFCWKVMRSVDVKVKTLRWVPASRLTELLKVIKREVKEAGQGWASPVSYWLWRGGREGAGGWWLVG